MQLRNQVLSKVPLPFNAGRFDIKSKRGKAMLNIKSRLYDFKVLRMSWLKRLGSKVAAPFIRLGKKITNPIYRFGNKTAPSISKYAGMASTAMGIAGVGVAATGVAAKGVEACGASTSICVLSTRVKGACACGSAVRARRS